MNYLTSRVGHGREKRMYVSFSVFYQQRVVRGRVMRGAKVLMMRVGLMIILCHATWVCCIITDKINSIHAVGSRAVPFCFRDKEDLFLGEKSCASTPILDVWERFP